MQPQSSLKLEEPKGAANKSWHFIFIIPQVSVKSHHIPIKPQPFRARYHEIYYVHMKLISESHMEMEHQHYVSQ